MAFEEYKDLDVKPEKKQCTKGNLVRNIPNETCFTCVHYGCTDGIETICQGYKRAGMITIFFRKLINSNNR